MSQRTISLRKSWSLCFQWFWRGCAAESRGLREHLPAGWGVFCNSANLTDSLGAEILYPCLLKLLFLLLTSSAAVKTLRHQCLFFRSVALFFVPWIPRYRHLLEDSLSWFCWVSHTFKSILLLQDTNVCFLSPCILVINPVKNHGYWDALVLPVSVCFKTLPLPYPLLEAALLLACRASDWRCGSFQ